MEVAALQSLHQFDFTKSQLETLQKLATGTMQKSPMPNAGKVSKELRDKLVALRRALVDGKDGERISKLSDDLEALRDKEEPGLDDTVQITEAARQRVPAALRLLKPTQLAAYVADNAEDIADPADELIESLTEVRGMTAAEWQEEREEVVEEVSRIVAGLDSAKAKKIGDEVNALLLKARSLSKAQFQNQQAEFHEAARRVVGNVSMLDVLRHQIELDLATLLSNPRLPQALAARLK
jgi:hypothetical protein